MNYPKLFALSLITLLASNVVNAADPMAAASMRFLNTIKAAPYNVAFTPVGKKPNREQISTYTDIALAIARDPQFVAIVTAKGGPAGTKWQDLFSTDPVALKWVNDIQKLHKMGEPQLGLTALTLSQTMSKLSGGPAPATYANAKDALDNGVVPAAKQVAAAANSNPAFKAEIQAKVQAALAE